MSDGLAPPPFDPDGAAGAAERFAARAEPDVAYAVHDTPVGRVVLARTRRGLVRVAYEDFNGGEDAVAEDLATRLSPRVLRAPARLDDVRRQLDEFFAGDRRGFELPLDWSLAHGFGRKVLQATARIPFGETGTYASVAARAGSPKAVRAAGSALGRNPMPIVVPCHRVLRSGGALGQYTGGVERKIALLTVEGAL